MNAFDFDGVVSIGLRPSPEDVIITGRSYGERAAVAAYLAARGIEVPVYYYPSATIRGHSRTDSALWKLNVLSILSPVLFFENDERQYNIIIAGLPAASPTTVIRIVEDLTAL